MELKKVTWYQRRYFGGPKHGRMDGRCYGPNRPLAEGVELLGDGQNLAYDRVAVVGRMLYFKYTPQVAA